jgi:tetratricopeptide (TPR) repeat protein
MQMSAKAGILVLILLLLIPAVAAEDAMEWYTKAQNAATNGDYTDAVTYYTNSIAVNPSYDAAYAGEAAALNALGQYSAALTAANQALAIRTSTTALGARADALFYLGQYNDAIGAYTNYTAVVTNQESAYCNLAYSYVMVNNSAQALTTYSQCTNLNPNDPLIWNQIGMVDMSLGKYTDALSAFNKATALTTTNAEIWNNKGEVLLEMGQYQDAISCFNTALTLDPTNTAAQENLNAAMGKGQVYTYTITPTPTEVRWYLGGVPPTTAAPTQTETPSVNATQVVQTATLPPATQATPVPTRTTYSPLPPVLALAALGAVAVLLTRVAGKGKNR